MAWHLSMQGHSCSLLSPLTTDKFSDEIIQKIQDCGINFVGPRLEGRIPGQKIEIRSDGEKIFSPFDHGVLKDFEHTADQVNFTEIDIVLGPVHRETLPFFDRYIRNKKPQQKLFLDFTTLREFEYKPENLMDLILNSELIQFSPEEDSNELVESLLKIELKNDQKMLVTLGSQGGILKDQQSQSSFKAPLLDKIVDTTGAGDAFFSSFIASYLQQKEMESCLENGKSFAAKAISRIGSTPITL